MPVLDPVEPGRPNVYARREGVEPDSPRALMLNGHVDTIPIGDSDPPALDGEWIVGRGAEDMKGGLVAMAHAASAVNKMGLPLAGNLTLTAVVGHETPVGKKEGANRVIELVRAGELRAGAIIIVEGLKDIWAASSGFVNFTLTVTSPRGRIHNLYVPYDENPARWLGEALRIFETWESEFKSLPPHSLTGREQLNVGILEAGDYMNRLPTPASVVGTHRWPPGTEWSDVRDRYESLCSDLANRSGRPCDTGPRIWKPSDTGTQRSGNRNAARRRRKSVRQRDPGSDRLLWPGPPYGTLRSRANPDRRPRRRRADIRADGCGVLRSIG